MYAVLVGVSTYLLESRATSPVGGEGTWVYLIMCKILRYSPML